MTGPGTPPRPNPLLTPSTLRFQAPPFDIIVDTDFRDAFDEGMRVHRDEVDSIANESAAPTFENTLVALERSGQTLMRVSSIFSVLASANTNDTLQQLQQDVAPKLAAHYDAILLNPTLFARVDTLYADHVSRDLDAESRRLLDIQHQRFVLAGARLSANDKAALMRLNEEEAALSAEYLGKLLAATRNGALVVEDASELDGLSAADIAEAATAAASRQLDGRWILTLVNTTQQPLLRTLKHRTTRERLFQASLSRTSRGDANDTSATIRRLAEIRAARARLFGQPSHAAWRLQNQMASSPDRVDQFLRELAPAAVARVSVEQSDIQRIFETESPGGSIEAWDWQFYAEQVRQAQYDLSTADLTPYLELERVLRDGVFYAAQQLYGVTVIERTDFPVYHHEVRVFEVLDASGEHLGLFYADFFRRDNKNGGAWMDNLLPQSTLLGTQPIVCNILNFTRPAAGQPALLSLDEVLTLFHEFGHALHGLFADQRYASLSGTAVARDFVELPALFNEYWALDPTVFANLAKHHVTGEAMPAALASRVTRAAKFNQGYSLTEILAAAVLDLQWHSLSDGSPSPDVDEFEQNALREARLALPAIPPRYHSRYFLHIWANGYDAGYYAYLWAEMLSHDAFAWFTEHGGLTRDNGQRFRDLILSRGNTRDYDDMFRDFRGRGPAIEPMLEYRGLAQ